MKLGARQLFRRLVLIACLLLAGWKPCAAAEYVIQPKDVLSVRISTEPALSQNYTVDDRGNLSIPLDKLGPVQAAGLTPSQLRDKLAKELSRYLKLFDVSVVVVEEAGVPILVYGEVAKPGKVRVKPGTRLLDVLTQVGQPTQVADIHRITVVRASGNTETVDLDALLKEPERNLALEGGESITVPSRVAQTVQINGEVKRIGTLPLEAVRTAFAAVNAAGATERTDWSRVSVRRRGSEKAMMLDLTPVRSGQAEDNFTLQAGDEITVQSRFSGTAMIRGEVNAAGERELTGPAPLLDFINGPGGGFKEAADRERVQIIRPNQPVKTVNLAEVINGQRRADDPELQVRAGDTVFIPSAKAILRGEVKAPGEKAIGATDNLWDFISSAGGGFTDAADRSKVQIIRGDKVVRTVDFTQLTRGAGNGQSPELEVQPGDIVFVPNDEPARFAIVGGVKNPGRYPARPGMTLLDAVAAAGGFTDKVTHKQFVIAPADSYDAEGKFKGKLPGSGKSGKPKKEDDEDLATYGLKVVEYKRLIKGDPSQNVVIRPGDRVLIPEDQPDQKSRGGGVFGSILRLIGVAGMFGGFGL